MSDVEEKRVKGSWMLGERRVRDREWVMARTWLVN
jgi:hypothetical protein